MNMLIIFAGLILALLGAALTVVLALRAGASSRRANPDGSPAPKARAPKWPLAFVVLGLAAVVAGNCFTVVPTGYTGVRTTFGLIDQESCMPGFNFVTPFVQNISLVNNKQQDIRFTDQIWSETQEQTVVYMENVTVTYQIVPEASAWIYANVENWVEELVDIDLVSSALKSASRSLSADVVTDRSVIETAAQQQLQAALDGKYGENRVAVKNVIINNMDFDESYNQAIAQKSQAIQEQQEQAIRNQTNIDKAKAEAEAERERAQGQADAELIQAQAKAEANRIISQSITAATQRQDVINRWNGELPRYAGGDASFGILDAFDLPAASSQAPASTPTPQTGSGQG